MHTPIQIYTGRVRRSPKSRRLWLAMLGGLGLILIFTGIAHASVNNWINEAESGVFLLKDESGAAMPALTLDTDVDIAISGPVARVTVVQRFRNPGAQFAEGTYVFPLPEGAAVFGMELHMGHRRIVGEIHEKQAARRIYAQARAQGKRAGLVEQRRANAFTTAVANIPPGEDIAVRLEYLEVLQRQGNQFSLRLPLTLTPRYRPALDQAHPLDLPVDSPMESVLRYAAETGLRPRVPDVSGPFYLRTTRRTRTNHATVQVSLDAGGIDVSGLHSRSHQIEVRQQAGRQLIAPWDGAIPMDRDFLLHWRLSPGQQAAGTLFTETIGGEHFGLLMLVPPDQVSPLGRLPREMLFVIDTSGSMGGESIRQARAALVAALDRLHPGDRFNIIEFDDRFSRLYPQPVPVADDTLAAARRFVTRLDAGGGTEMLAPLRAALTMHPSDGYLRQIMFITDGAVSNEHAIFAAVHEQLGNARLFTVGIGSAPNSFFMKKAAAFGRGTFTYIGDTGEVSQQMAELFARLEKPMMRDLSIAVADDIPVEQFPKKVPDLYAGEPVLVAMKLRALPDWIDVSGQGHRPWSTRINTAAGRQHPGTGTLWARQKIESLMDRIVRGEAEEAVRPQVVAVALRHRLVSRYTSFVAVDHTPVRAAQAPLGSQNLANQLPKGLAWPRTATGVDYLWALCAWLLLACLVLAWRQWSLRHETA